MFRLPSARPLCAALLTVASAGTEALAQGTEAPGDPETVWSCWYNGDSTFRCRLVHAPADSGDEDADPARPAPRSSPYPRRGPLPAIVTTIQEHPARLRGRTITIPLFTPLRDMDFAATLVQSVMCAGRPACRTLVFRSSADAFAAYEEDPARE